MAIDHDQFPLDGTSCSSVTKLAPSAWHKTPLTSHRIAPISAARCQGLYVSVPSRAAESTNSFAGFSWEFKFTNSLADLYCAATNLGLGVLQRRPFEIGPAGNL